MAREPEEREAIRLQAVAQEYMKKGYKVTVNPGPADLPGPLAGFRPDLIAVSGSETVIVEVKTRSTLSKAKYLTDLAKAVEERPGWRLELVVTNPRGVGTVPGEAELIAPEIIVERFSNARLLAQTGQLDAAMLLAWSAAEGALRIVSEREGVYLGRRGPSYIVKHLYSIGLVPEGSFEILTVGLQFRNRLVHGFSDPSLDVETVNTFIDVAEDVFRKYEGRME